MNSGGSYNLQLKPEPRSKFGTATLPYTVEELARIREADLKVFGDDPLKHPCLTIGTRQHRPILFPEKIEKLNIEAGDNRCQLNCDFCYQSSTYPFSRSLETYMAMPISVAKKIIDALPNLKTLVPYSINEPGLKPKNMKETIEYFWEKRKGKIYISTNLSLPWCHYEEWIGNPGIEKVSIGCGGVRKDIHEKIRKNSKWPVLIDNIEKIVALRRQTGRPRIVELQFIDLNMGDTLHDMEAFCKKMGVQGLQLKKLALKTPESIKLIPEKNTPVLKKHHSILDQPCGYMFEGVSIVLSSHHNTSLPGPKVSMCVCGYFSSPDDRKYIRGDLTRQSLFHAINDHELQKARFSHLSKGMGEIDICRYHCDCRKPLMDEYVKGGVIVEKRFPEND